MPGNAKSLSGVVVLCCVARVSSVLTNCEIMRHEQSRPVHFIAHCTCICASSDRCLKVYKNRRKTQKGRREEIWRLESSILKTNFVTTPERNHLKYKKKHKRELLQEENKKDRKKDGAWNNRS
jgi:hypothetical protein